MQKETIRIARYFRAASEKQPWHGNAVSNILSDITAKQAAAKPIKNAHSIWEILLHVNSWRLLVLERLQGNEEFEIDLNTPQDWPEIPEINETNWQKTLAEYADMTQKLGEAIEKFEDQNLDAIISGKKYNWYYLLHGIIHHDIYHSGQIQMLKKKFK